MTEEEVTLQAVQQFVEQHPQRVEIEKYAALLRQGLRLKPEICRAAIALVGAELAAAP